MFKNENLLKYIFTNYKFPQAICKEFNNNVLLHSTLKTHKLITNKVISENLRIKHLVLLTDNNIACSTSGSDGDRLCFFDSNYKCIHQVIEQLCEIRILALPNGLLASWSLNATIKIYSNAIGYPCIHVLNCKVLVFCLLWLPIGYLVAGCDSVIKIFRENNNFEELEGRYDVGVVASLVAIKDYKFASSSWDFIIKIWDYIEDKYNCVKVIGYKRDTYCTMLRLNEGNIVIHEKNLFRNIKTTYKLCNEDLECIETISFKYVIDFFIILSDDIVVAASGCYLRIFNNMKELKCLKYF
jgi:hypothetical protein